MTPTAPTRVRWIVLAVLVVAGFVAYLLRTNVSVAGDAIMADLALDKIQFGRVLAAFAWAYALFQLPGGIFGQRLGARRALLIMASAWAGLTLAVGLLPGSIGAAATIAALVGLRGLMGAAQAPLYPVTAGAIGRWFPLSGWGLPNGLSSTGGTLGAAAAGPIVAWLTITMGWRLSFAALAPLALAVGIGWWWLARDEPTDHRWVNQAEIDLITQLRPPPEAHRPIPWHAVARNRELVLLTFSYFCMNYVFYIFFNWLYIYLSEVRGFSALEGGFVAAIPWLAGAAVAPLGGLWCDRLARRLGPRLGYRIPGVTGTLGAAVLLMLGATADNAAVAVALLAGCLASTQLTEGAYWAAATAVADRHTMVATGLLNTGGNAAGGVGALLVSFTAQELGWIPALATGSVFAVLGAAAWFFIRADRPLVTEP